MPEEIKAIVYETDGWFMALCTHFPGVTGEGRSRDECISDLTEKIEQHIEQTTTEVVSAEASSG